MALFARSTYLPCKTDQRIQTTMEIPAKGCYVSDLTIVRKVNRFRLKRKKAINRGMHGIRLELRWRRCREYEGMTVNVVLPVR